MGDVLPMRPRGPAREFTAFLIAHIGVDDGRVRSIGTYSEEWPTSLSRDVVQAVLMRAEGDTYEEAAGYCVDYLERFAPELAERYEVRRD